MRRPRQHKTKATVYAVITVVMVPVVAIGVLVGIMLVGKNIESLRGGRPGAHYIREDYAMMIIVVWMMVFAVLQIWSFLIAFRVWRRVARPIGEGFCIGCGYDLSGTIEFRRDCPECGRSSR